MPDNVAITPGVGASVSTEEVTTLNGGAVSAQHVQRVALSMRTADGTAVDVPGDAANGIDVDVTRSALPAGASTSAKQDAIIAALAALGTAANQTAIAGLLGAIETLLAGIDADTDAIKTATETVDNAIAGSEMQVDVVTSSLPTGAATAANQATAIGHLADVAGNLIDVEGVLTTIDADTSALAGAVSGTEVQVDVVTLPAIPAGTNNIGDVDIASIAAGDHNIGNVDVATVPADPFGANADAAATAGSAGSIQAKLRLVTSQLDAIKTALETIDNAVGGSELQVDIVGAIPAGTNNIGDVDVASVVPGTGATSLGKAEDAAHATGDTGVMALGVRNSALAALTTTDGDYSPIATDDKGRVIVAPVVGTPGGDAASNTLGYFADGAGSVRVGAVALFGYNGSTWDRLRSDTTNGLDVDVTRLPALAAGTNNIGDVDVLTLPAITAGTNLIGRVSSSDETSTLYDGTTALTPKFAIIDAATSGDNTLVAAVVGKKIRVLACFLVAAGAVTARFESGAGGTAKTGQMNLAANGGFVLPYNPVGWFETASNTLLNLELSGAVSVDGSLVYIEV